LAYLLKICWVKVRAFGAKRIAGFLGNFASAVAVAVAEAEAVAEAVAAGRYSSGLEKS